MNSDRLHHPPLMPHLLVEGLNRYDDEPCLFLGDKVASYREVRESTSQMVQALHATGLGEDAEDDDGDAEFHEDLRDLHDDDEAGDEDAESADELGDFVGGHLQETASVAVTSCSGASSAAGASV